MVSARTLLSNHVLAHQGGWDEALLVIGPLAVIGGLLHMANRRLKARLEELSDNETPSASEPSVRS